MPREPIWRRYLRFLRPDLARDVDDELAFHLQALEDEYAARGVSRDEARQLARARFGDMRAARAECLAVDGRRARVEQRAEMMDALLQDVRYAVRTLWQERGFAVTVIVTLALGIGATTAMFSAVDAALLRPLPFPQASELVALTSVHVPFSMPGYPPSPPATVELPTVAAMRDVFRGTAAYAAGGLNLTGEGEPERVRVGVVTTDFFATLGVFPVAGRVFSPEEGRPGGAATVIISNALWRRRFGGAPVLETTLKLNDRPFRIVGIMPDRFAFPEQSDLWIPMTVPVTFATFEPFRGFLPSRVIARIGPGVSRSAVAERMRREWRLSFDSANSYRAEALAKPFIPLQEHLVGDRRTPLLVLLGATVLLMLIACANVTNLLLARGSQRRREFAVRAVLGASRFRIARQLLIESLILSLAGSLAGLLVAFGCLGTVRALLPAQLSDLAMATIDLRVMSFAIVLATVTGLGFGIWPALGASRADAGEVMKSGGYAATSGGVQRLRSVLVAGELAVALSLLAGAGLMLRSFKALLDTDPGFNAQHVATAEITFGQARGAARSARLTVLDRAIERLRGMPGVEAAGVINDLPLRGSGGISITVNPEGRPLDQGRGFARYLQASEGYFHALGIPLLRGRLMRASDDSAAPRVLVISSTMARVFWPGEDAVGKRVIDATAHVGSKPGPAVLDATAFRTVIGVVADVRESHLEDTLWPQMYFPIHEQPPVNAAIVVRGAASSRTLLNYLREAMHAADPLQALYNVRTMDDVLSGSLAPRRVNTALMTAFASLALLIAAVGVYGVVAYGVTRRQREFGIRAALGATAGDLVRLAIREGAAMGLVGVMLGLIGSHAVTRVIRSLLYGVQPTDPISLAAAPVLLFACVVIATLVPAQRAAHVNPMDIIRSE